MASLASSSAKPISGVSTRKEVGTSPIEGITLVSRRPGLGGEEGAPGTLYEGRPSSSPCSSPSATHGSPSCKFIPPQVPVRTCLLQRPHLPVHPAGRLEPSAHVHGAHILSMPPATPSWSRRRTTRARLACPTASPKKTRFAFHDKRVGRKLNIDLNLIHIPWRCWRCGFILGEERKEKKKNPPGTEVWEMDVRPGCECREEYV